LNVAPAIQELKGHAGRRVAGPDAVVVGAGAEQRPGERELFGGDEVGCSFFYDYVPVPVEFIVSAGVSLLDIARAPDSGAAEVPPILVVGGRGQDKLGRRGVGRRGYYRFVVGIIAGDTDADAGAQFVRDLEIVAFPGDMAGAAIKAAAAQFRDCIERCVGLVADLLGLGRQGQDQEEKGG